MKKLSPKLKKHLISRGIHEVTKRKKRNAKHYREPSLSESLILRSSIINRPFHKIFAPKVFNLKNENVEKTISFINELKNFGDRRYNIRIEMGGIIEIGDGAIAMLLSVLSELQTKKIYIQGTYPDNIDVKDKLERSGFFNYMKGVVSERNSKSKNSIITTGRNDGNQIVLSKEVRKANETVWGSNGRNPVLYACIVEMMRNSCDHAFDEKKKTVWHLSLSHDDDDKNVNFSFVDNGNGIMHTFTKEKTFRKIYSVFKDESKILHAAYLSGIESTTGLKWRGKGLPTIYETYRDNDIAHLVVISNNVYIDFKNNVVRKMSTTFDGTYYYWNQNTKCNKSCF